MVSLIYLVFLGWIVHFFQGLGFQFKWKCVETSSERVRVFFRIDFIILNMIIVVFQVKMENEGRASSLLSLEPGDTSETISTNQQIINVILSKMIIFSQDINYDELILQCISPGLLSCSDPNCVEVRDFSIADVVYLHKTYGVRRTVKIISKLIKKDSKIYNALILRITDKSFGLFGWGKLGQYDRESCLAFLKSNFADKAPCPTKTTTKKRLNLPTNQTSPNSTSDFIVEPAVNVGDHVAVRADTTPCVHPRFATGLLEVEVMEIDSVGGFAVVSSVGIENRRKRRVSLQTLESCKTSREGLGELFSRGAQESSTFKKKVVKLESENNNLECALNEAVEEKVNAVEGLKKKLQKTVTTAQEKLTNSVASKDKAIETLKRNHEKALEKLRKDSETKMLDAVDNFKKKN